MSDPNLDPNRLPPSLWAATAPPAPATMALPPGRSEADLVVVGAGFTGLSAALHAAARGVKVVVLEAVEVGWGASGRNNGLVIPALTRADPDVLVQAFGPLCGGTLVQVLRDSADVVFDLARQHRIDCEAVQNGWVQPAHRESRLALSKSRFEQWHRHGAPVRLLDRDEVAAITGSHFWHGGWINPTGGHLNPLAFARGLARAAIDAGATVHTRSPVTAVQREGERWRVVAGTGEVITRRVLLATHSYTGFVIPNPWPGLPRTLVPVRSYQMATQPVPAALRATVMPSNAAMSDTQADLHFVHWDAQGRLVSGGALALGWHHDERLRRRIGARLLKLFPQLEPLGTIGFDHLWHGVFAATPDKLPRFWRLADGVIAWVGCNGRGVALATALGPLLADALLDGESAASRLPFESPRPIAGHLFAPIGVAAATVRGRWADARD